MSGALFYLENVLRSKRENLSLVEANMMMTWKAHARRDFYVGLGGASVVTWLATKRLRYPLRFALTLGAGVTCGTWLSLRSLESSADRILSLEGSRIQRELANLMMQKYSGDPRVQHRLSKHFYPEEVYDDSSADRPRLRWRYKNFSGEVNHSQGTSYSEETDPKKNNNNMKKTTTMKPKQVHATADYVRAAADSMESPFDLIFGLAESAEAASQQDGPPESSKRRMRKERRSRRRHRWHHHHEESDI